MAVETIKVRKRNNHSITRSIRKSALSAFVNRGWEPVEQLQTAQATEVKKKQDVEPAEVAAEVEQSNTEFVSVGDPETERTIDTLREEYQILSGKPADGRWSEKRLNDELEKLKV